MKQIILLFSSLILAFSLCNAEKREGVWQELEPKQLKKALKDVDLELLEEAEPETIEGFVALFDESGDDAQILGGTADFKWENGVLTGTSVEGNPKNAWYCTKKNYRGNMILSFYWKWGRDVAGNSGVMLCGGLNKKGWLDGIQIEVEQDINRAWTGGVYAEGAFKWQYTLSRKEHEEARKACANLYEWNKLTIMYKDGIIKTWSNGVPCANLKWNKDLEAPRREVSPEQDVIGFQVHKGKAGSVIHFKDIKIKEL